VVASETEWVLLSYRLPREPSTPRIAVWRRLRRLGTAQLGDGLVGLPWDARTQEQLEWVAQEVAEAGGLSTLWRGRPTSVRDEHRLVSQLAAARDAEYRDIRDRAESATELDGPELAKVVRSLRRELRQVKRRDYFPPPGRDQATIAVETLAQRVPAATHAVSLEA
jgi:hypothetical protein